MDLDALILSRLQFAFTIAFHTLPEPGAAEAPLWRKLAWFVDLGAGGAAAVAPRRLWAESPDRELIRAGPLLARRGLPR